MKKRLLTLALAVAMVLSFTACGSMGQDSMTLSEWMETDDAKQAESETNSALASTGMSVTLAADGNMFVYEYHLSGDLQLPSGDELEQAFGPVIEANKAGLDSLFSSFEETYGIKLEGARFVFLDSEGNEIYSGDVLNE